jgi:hypothetical protein
MHFPMMEIFHTLAREEAKAMTEPTKDQLKRVVDAFSHEMTEKYWQKTPEGTREEFRQWMLEDLERLVVIVRAIR